MRSTLLAGDIGGTKTILRLVQGDTDPDRRQVPRLTTIREQVYSSQSYPDLVPMVRDFFGEGTVAGGAIKVDEACFGIAGPVARNASELTNLRWSLSGERLQHELGILKVTLINDFAAIGYGVLALAKDEIATLQDAPADPTAPIAIIGAGTGLGEGFLIPQQDGTHRAFPSEGGHTDFAPGSDLDFQLLKYLRERLNLDRVSVERVVSGAGIASIYQFFRDANPEEESAEMAEVYRAWSRETGKEEKPIDLSAEVSKAALTRRDALSERAMRLFVSTYGAEAGNLALKILPHGGLYVAGGIAPKILPLLQEDTFMKAFCSKGRMRPLLEKVPVHVVLNPTVGLLGAALYAAQRAVTP